MKKKYLVIFFCLIYFPKRDSYPEEQRRLLTAINTWCWEGTDRQKDTWSYNLPLVAFPTSCFICSHLLCALRRTLCSALWCGQFKWKAIRRSVLHSLLPASAAEVCVRLLQTFVLFLTSLSVLFSPLYFCPVWFWFSLERRHHILHKI